MLAEDENLRVTCYECFRSVKACLCSIITPQMTQNRFIILMHPMEFKKQKTGSGRICHLGLKNSEIIVGVDFTHDKRINEIIARNQSAVLYPGVDAINVSTCTNEPLSEIKDIFLIDATWPCAKKMMRKSLNLQNLKKISFNTTTKSKFIIKQQPHEDCLATIEATSVLISILKNKKLENTNFDHQKFLYPFEDMIRNQIKCASDPSVKGYRRKPYKDVNVRVRLKKSRNLFYENGS